MLPIQVTSAVPWLLKYTAAHIWGWGMVPADTVSVSHHVCPKAACSVQSQFELMHLLDRTQCAVCSSDSSTPGGLPQFLLASCTETGGRVQPHHSVAAQGSVKDHPRASRRNSGFVQAVKPQKTAINWTVNTPPPCFYS